MSNEIRIPKILQKRIIKRHGFATGFYAVLMLICAAVPIVSLFFANIHIEDPLLGATTSMTGLDILKCIAFQDNLIIRYMNAYPSVFSSITLYAWPFVFALGLLLCWPLTVAFIQICKGLKLIFYGQSRHMARPIFTCFMAIFSYLIFEACCFVGLYLLNGYASKGGLTTKFGIDTIQLIFLGVEIFVFILMIIVNSICFANKAYIYEIDFDKYEEDIILEDLKPIEAKGIDVNGPTISSHQYSKTNIFYAHIPIGVTSIGIGAFSNCVHLKQVFIPKSTKNIGSNAFFNCVSLEKIVYNGTKDEWSRVVRGSNWLLRAGTNIVLCKDGAIQVSVVD